MDSSAGLGSLSILNEDLLRLILRDEALSEGLHCLASSSTCLLRQVLISDRAKELMLDLRGVKLAAMWGKWLQHASGLHLHLRSGYFHTVEEAAAILALLLPGPNRGISALTVNLYVSDAQMMRMGLIMGWQAFRTAAPLLVSVYCISQMGRP